MFATPIGRGRFFAYSAMLLVAEIAGVLLCIGVTIGFHELANSSPGPAREGLALAILILSLLFVAIRGNIAWRRSREAGCLKWTLGGYIAFSAIFAVLQAGTFLVYTFGGDNSNIGLNMLGLAITGLWFRILLARPAGGDWHASAFADQVADELQREPAPAAPPARAAHPKPSALPASAGAGQRLSPGRGGRFGRRGLV